MSVMGKRRNLPWGSGIARLWEASHRRRKVYSTAEPVERGRSFYAEYRALCAKYNAEIEVVDLHSVGVYVDGEPLLYTDGDVTAYIFERCYSSAVGMVGRAS